MSPRVKHYLIFSTLCPHCQGWAAVLHDAECVHVAFCRLLDGKCVRCRWQL